MNKSRKEYSLTKKEVDKILKEKYYERDGDNRVVINMSVKDDTNFVSVFSENDTPVISTEVAEFIENKSSSVPLKEQLTLRITSDCVDDDEKRIYDKAIKKYYVDKYNANQKELKRNNFIALLLGIIGLGILVFLMFLKKAYNVLVWTELTTIFTWVIMWEAVDILVFRNQELRVKRRRYMSYVAMKIEYIDIPKKRKSKASTKG